MEETEKIVFLQRFQNCTHYKHLLMREASQILVNYGIRPSVQRTSIYEYLLTHCTHPTVDEIYEALNPTIPTLSKTTIYNTLTLFAEKGAVLVLNMDGKKQHFDACTEEHAHFICQCCGKIYDFPYPMVSSGGIPDNYCLKQIDVTYRGICPDCLLQETQNLLK